MNVYLVPAANGRHELYCEVPSTPADSASHATTSDSGFRTAAPRNPWTRVRLWARTKWDRLVEGFRRMVEEGEAHSHGRVSEAAASHGRVRRFITRKVAEAVAEQRLLWLLRHESTITLVHPDFQSDADAVAIAKAKLSADYAKHRRWLAIDTLLVLITGPLFFFVPGPNVISWYFAFRAVGHFFALRGALHGLSSATWNGVGSKELTALRAALALDGETRTRRIDEIAAALGLERLPLFIRKVA